MRNSRIIGPGRAWINGASSVAIACSLGFAGQAHAQDAEPPAAEAGDPAPVEPEAAPAGPGAGTEEIVITARKRSELARNVPVAVSAISGVALVEQNISRLTDIVALVPNFSLSLAAAQPVTFVRGFGTAGGASFEQAVGKFVDNVSYGRDYHARIPLFDIERFELLKGPQVLLYGNSATAGALNITTRKPGHSFAADASVAYEFVNNELVVQGGVTAPLADWASVRVAGFFQDLDKGWIYNEGIGEHQPTFHNYAVRPTLRLTPTPELDILLKVEVDRVHDRGNSGQSIRQASSPARAFPEVELDDRKNTNYGVAPFFAEEYNTLKNETYQADVNYDLGGDTLTSTTAFIRSRNGNNSGSTSQLPAFLVSTNALYKQFSQELRLSGRTGNFEYLVGGYYQHDEFAAFQIISTNLAAYGLPIPAFTRYSTIDQNSDSYSAFGDLTWHFTDQFSLEAGARYSIIRKRTDQASNPTSIIAGIDFDTSIREVDALINPALNPLLTSVFGAVAHDLRGIKTRENHLQPQVVAQYRIDNRNMVYGKFVQGDKAGGVDYTYAGSVRTGATAEGAQFAPEQARSFEVGFKGISSDSKLEYSLIGYNTTFTDLQTSVFVGTSLVVSNVGKARTRGIELDLVYRPVRGLRLSATGAHQDAKYLDYPGAACTVGQVLATPPGTACMQDLSGEPTPYSSKWSGSFGVAYERQVGGWEVTGGASVVARSRYHTAANNDPLGIQDGFAQIDANLGFGPVDGPWQFSLFGRNLTDILYKEYSVASPLVPGGFSTYVSRGRQIGVRLGARF